MVRASSSVKIGTLDGGYCIESHDSMCWQCKHRKRYVAPSCSVYPKMIPYDIWNNKKKCSKREERE